uniref:NAD(P)H-quinone oxidoreductase subunit 5, chloroplastic n=1 Tax=Terniopsis yongtaiensis TaxID=2925018 RepID=A0AA51YFN9_9ROSI|nr:NADH-plastoquinone oxidoreductase subunit 5 [Terniopsis yongtaiensis]WMV00962.1 NADH-plastoquinone oxidoreductase subunit 5 [Terniopsis yongtaiensis]
MEHTYNYSGLIPLISLLMPILIGGGLLLFPRATKKLRRKWAFPNVLVLGIVIAFFISLLFEQINNSSSYQYLYSWTITNDLSFEFGFLIDSLSCILSILISTVGICVLIYSDNYMSHDQGYLRFFSYISFFTTAMLGLVTSSNLIQIYIFWELIGMCSYLLIGFWFMRPNAANACQKAFITNRVGDFGLLLGILGFYWLTGSFEFSDLFSIVNNLIYTNDVTSFFIFLCSFCIFSGALAKSAQFPLHIWLPDAMEGPTPISALIHAATLVAAGIFLVARLFPLFIVIPSILNIIALIGILTVVLGATLALAQKDIKRSLAYSTMSQLGYMMLALGIGSYQAALFHLITHAYSKALLFLGSGSIIHSMEAISGYSPDKSQNMSLMGGLIKHIPITRNVFLVGTLSLCGIPPLACFWSKDAILAASWQYSPVFAILASLTAGLTAFYMLRIYLLTFEGHFNYNFQNYNGKTNSLFYSISLWGKEENKIVPKIGLFSVPLLILNKNDKGFLLGLPTQKNNANSIKGVRPFISINFFRTNCSYPQESDTTMLVPMLFLGFCTLFIGVIGISFKQFNLVYEVNILSKLFTPALNHFIQNSLDLIEFFLESTFSLGIVFVGIVISCLFYNPPYSSFQNLTVWNSFAKKNRFRNISDKLLTFLYNWSFNRGYIDTFYTLFVTKTLRQSAEFIFIFDKNLVDGFINALGIGFFFMGEVFKSTGWGRISFYLLFYSFFLFVFLIIFVSKFYF